jgi:small subunit ribosomal protein S20
MGHSLSADKRERQNKKLQMRNRVNRSVLRTSLRNCKKQLDEGKVEPNVVFACAQKAFDVAARKGAISKKRASRRASRLALALAKRKAVGTQTTDAKV